MPRRRRLLTEFSIQVFADGRIAWDGFDRLLWELAHGDGSVKQLAIRSNSRDWRQLRRKGSVTKDTRRIKTSTTFGRKTSRR